MFENIIRNISRFITITSEEEKFFTDLLVCQSFPKKTILLREGEICQFEDIFIKDVSECIVWMITVQK